MITKLLNTGVIKTQNLLDVLDGVVVGHNIVPVSVVKDNLIVLVSSSEKVSVLLNGALEIDMVVKSCLYKYMCTQGPFHFCPAQAA